MSKSIDDIRKQIGASVNKNKTHKLRVPDWGDGHFYVRKFRASEGKALEDILGALSAEKPSVGDTCVCFAKVCVLALCDENGKRIFENGCHAELMEHPIPVLKRVAEAALDFNALTERAQEALAGNLPAGQVDDSRST